ncbi:MAG: hypothetical protein WBC67_02450 [Candidatus Acidiferrales bacterium]
MAEDLDSLLKQLDTPEDPVLPSVERILAGLRDDRFTGTVELKYEAGRVVLVRKR